MDLQTFIFSPERGKDLQRIRVTVDPRLEVAALCRREFASGTNNRILLFEQITGSPFPLVANLFGTEQRAAQLLGSASLAGFSRRLTCCLRQKTGSARQRLRLLGTEPPLTAVNAPVYCQQLLAEPDVTQLPAICSWPAEKNPYLTLALLLSRHPETAALNLGLYRAQLLDKQRIAVNFSPASGAADHLRAARRLQRPLPVSLILGGDPAWIWAASAPLPPGCNEFSFCQQQLQRAYQFAACVSQPLSVPTSAEMIIEGEIRPADCCQEGPFGNHTGSYVSRADCPLMRVTAITHRQRPIIPITVVGPPPSENIYLAKANEVLIRTMLQIDYPAIRDLQMPLATIFHGVSLLAVAPQSTADNRALIDSLWQQSPLARAKLLVLLDEDIDLTSFSQAWWRVINQFSKQKIYHDAGRLAIDATGIDRQALVVESHQTRELLERRRSEYNL